MAIATSKKCLLDHPEKVKIIPEGDLAIMSSSGTFKLTPPDI